MERVRKGEVEIRVWLKESEEKFRCPICGKSLSSGSLRSKCYHCGQNYQGKPLTDLVRRQCSPAQILLETEKAEAFSPSQGILL